MNRVARAPKYPFKPREHVQWGGVLLGTVPIAAMLIVMVAAMAWDAWATRAFCS